MEVQLLLVVTTITILRTINLILYVVVPFHPRQPASGCLLSFLSSPKDMLTEFREKGKEGEIKEEKHRSVASC